MIEIRTDFDIDIPFVEGTDRKGRRISNGKIVITNSLDNPNFVEVSIVYEAYFQGNAEAEERIISSGSVLIEDLYIALDAFRQIKRSESIPVCTECGKAPEVS